MVINHPDPRKRYYLQCDASNHAVGAVLYQLSDEGEEQIVGFASRTLKRAEMNYFTSEKELLAIVFALGKFRTFIVGAKLTIRTDHRALTFLFTCKLISSRLSRWILFIQAYTFDIEHVNGKDNTVPDTLSRYPSESKEETELIGSLVIIAPLAREVDEELINKLKSLEIYQRYDYRISELLNSINDRRNKRLIVKNNILYHLEPGGSIQAQVPDEILNQLVVECHETYGQIGAEKCYKVSREGFYYPKFYRRIRQIISKCESVGLQIKR